MSAMFAGTRRDEAIAIDAEGLLAGGSRSPSGTVLWTAGVAASPIPKVLGTKTGRAGRALTSVASHAADVDRRLLFFSLMELIR
jgi:NADH dehydrogenase FAD-containing subunit